MEIAVLAATSHAGKALAEVFPHLGFLPRHDAGEGRGRAIGASCDAVFCGLPHGTAQDIIARLPRSLKVIDMSADFRLRDTAVYAKWYGREHAAPHLLAEAVYGLTEYLRRRRSRGARLVACPGCYPTATLLALLPLVHGRADRRERHHHRRQVGRLGRRPLAQAEHPVFRGGRGAFALWRRQPPARARDRAGNRRRPAARGGGEFHAASHSDEPGRTGHVLCAARRRCDSRPILRRRLTAAYAAASRSCTLAPKGVIALDAVSCAARTTA